MSAQASQGAYYQHTQTPSCVAPTFCVRLHFMRVSLGPAQACAIFLLCPPAVRGQLASSISANAELGLSGRLMKEEQWEKSDFSNTCSTAKNGQWALRKTQKGNKKLIRISSQSPARGSCVLHAQGWGCRAQWPRPEAQETLPRFRSLPCCFLAL